MFGIFGKSKRGVAIFAKAFMGIPAQQAAKITRPLMPAAAPAVLLHLLDTQQGDIQHYSRNDSTRCRKSCIFTPQKTLRENTCTIASGDYSTPVSQRKNKIQDLIEQDGLDHATQRFAEVICDMLNSKELAYQFILEEIDAASQGDNEAMRFAFSSGIPSSEYKGAMQRSCPEIDGPQQFLLNISTQLHFDTDLMVEFRTKIADKVMKYFYLGKYGSNEPAGIKKFNQLKKLMLNEEISEALILSASGINQTSILIANDVNKAVSLVNYLSTLTGISGMELINAISENKHDKQITSIIIDKESLEEYEAVGSDDSWMDVLVQWANENNLAELQDFDSPAYKQTGFPRNKNQLRTMEYLHLPNSNISHLPPELGNLKKLYGICLDGNSIENYPKEMCEYKNLIRLDLDDNNISNFPREIGNLTSLQILSLENNCINDFPIEMKKLVNLRKLVLKGQAIH